MTLSDTTGRLSLIAVAALTVAGCAGNRAEPADPVADPSQSEQVLVCVENDTDYQITARIFGANGAPLLRLDTRMQNRSRDSIRRGEAQGSLYVGVDAVGLPDIHYPETIQRVAITGDRVGFRIAGQGHAGFPTSSVDPGPCGEE